MPGSKLGYLIIGVWDCLEWSPALQAGFQVGSNPTSSTKIS